MCLNFADSAVDSAEPDLTLSIEMEETPSSRIRRRRIISFDSANGNFFKCIFYIIYNMRQVLNIQYFSE